MGMSASDRGRESNVGIAPMDADHEEPDTPIDEIVGLRGKARPSSARCLPARCKERLAREERQERAGQDRLH